MSGDPLIRAFFEPRGVAVIGASTDDRKLGHRLVMNLIESGYSGAIHPVNPKGGKIRELSLYRSVRDVPDPVDLAVILIAAPLVPSALRATGQRGVRSVIIASAGFAEAGESGRILEAQCRAIATEFGIRVIGPNCIGTIDTHHPVDATFLNSGRTPAGSTALVSHSGAICAGIINMSEQLGLGWSRIASLGNQMDVDETDILAEFEINTDTRAVCLYLEGVRAKSGFVRAARSLSIQKPVFALKVGRSEAGRGAVTSHTGALAGDDAVYDAVFRHTGIIRLDSMSDLLVAAKAFGSGMRAGGSSVAVLTNAGGPGVAAIDVMERRGMTMAALSDESVSALRDLLPPAATVTNPVDMLASASVRDYAGGMRILLADDAVDSVLVVMPPPPHFAPDDAVRAILDVFERIDKDNRRKPVVFALVGGRGVDEAMRILDQSQIPSFRFPEQAALALSVLVERFRIEKEFTGQEDVGPTMDVSGVAQSMPADSGFLRPDFAIDLARACGIPTPRSVFAESPESVDRLARSVEFPVALKVASSQVVHKTDIGGIRVGVQTPVDLARAARQMAHLLTGPDDGFLIQTMVAPGLDIVVGAIRNPQFGPLVMFGSGGVEVEKERDVTFELPPLADLDHIQRMIARTRVGRRLLRTSRSGGDFDVAAVVNVIRRVSATIEQVSSIEEIEINPLRVYAKGEGVSAIDIRCRRS